MTEGHDLLGTLPCGCWTVRRDEKLTLEYANEYLYQMLGYTAEEAAACGLDSAHFIVEPEDWPQLLEQMNRQLSDGAPFFELEHRYTHHSGEARWLLVRGRAAADGCLSGIALDITTQKETEQLLQVSQEVARMSLSRGKGLVATYDVGYRTLILTQEAADWLGTPVIMDDMPQSALMWGLVDPESWEDFVHFFEYMNDGLPSGETLVRVKDAKGRQRWLEGEFTLLPAETGAPTQAVLYLQDVTERQLAALEYEQWRARLDHPHPQELGCYMYDLTRDAYERGFSAMGDAAQSYSDTVGHVAEHYIFSEDVAEYLRTFDRRHLLLRYYEGRQDVVLEHRRRGPENEGLWTEASAHLMVEPVSGDVKVVVSVRDIHEEKEQALRLQRMSERDPLTGFYNHRAMVEHIAETLRDSTPGACHAVLMMDIDQFTQLNDSYGHHFGDQVIRDLAEKLQGQLRAGDFCGRMGGDEFLLFFREVRGGSNLVPRLASMLRGLTHTYEDKCNVSMSIGMVNYPQNGRDFDTLYRKAELALKEAKKGGRCRYAIYAPGCGQ